MTYITHSATPLTVAAWWDQINNALAQHASWTQVEQVVSGAATAAVWKNNDTGYHFGNIKTATALQHTAFEGYNPANDSFSRPVVSTTNGDVGVPAADGSYGGGTEYPVFSASATVNPILNVISRTAPSGTTWQSVAVTARGVLLCVVNATLNDWTWIGTFDSLATVADPAPYGMISKAFNGRVSRYPTVTSAQASNWQLATTPGLWTPTSGSLNGRLDRLYGSRGVGSRLTVVHAGNPDTHGGLRGLLPSFLVQFAYTTYPTPGDTMTIGTDTYEVMQVSTISAAGNALLINRSAA